MNFLITGLGNIGSEYAGTRHNMGFRVVEALAAEMGAVWTDRRYGSTATVSVKNCRLTLLRPSTYMNLSGNAVRYWMGKENIPIERLLIVVDDCALPLGTLRMKPRGSEGGHNGLRHITQMLATQEYARLRIGIGNEFPRGGQIDYVLGRFSPEELTALEEPVKRATEAVKSFCLQGIERTMCAYNK